MPRSSVRLTCTRGQHKRKKSFYEYLSCIIVHEAALRDQTGGDPLAVCGPPSPPWICLLVMDGRVMGKFGMVGFEHCIRDSRMELTNKNRFWP